MTSANSIDPGLLARAAQALAALVEAARLGGEIAMRDFASGAKTGANIHYIGAMDCDTGIWVK